MKKLYLYIHGNGGSFKEAEFFENLVDGDVIGIDYDDNTPWVSKDIISNRYSEFSSKYDEINIIANSIGAWFCMLGLNEKNIKNAYFISPIVNMEKLICNMMKWSNITEQELKAKKEIPTNFGKTLSWEYLCFVRNNPIKWNVFTHILYGEKDNLTDFETMQNFAKEHNATLTVMKNGEHWFHTQEQMQFLKQWIKKSL